MMYQDLTTFEKKLAQFADKIDIIVGLELGGKLSSEEAYQRIKDFYKELKQLRKIEKKSHDKTISEKTERMP